MLPAFSASLEKCIREVNSVDFDRRSSLRESPKSSQYLSTQLVRAPEDLTATIHRIISFQGVKTAVVDLAVDLHDTYRVISAGGLVFAAHMLLAEDLHMYVADDPDMFSYQLSEPSEVGYFSSSFEFVKFFVH